MINGIIQLEFTNINVLTNTFSSLLDSWIGHLAKYGFQKVNRGEVSLPAWGD